MNPAISGAQIPGPGAHGAARRFVPSGSVSPADTDVAESVGVDERLNLAERLAAAAGEWIGAVGMLWVIDMGPCSVADGQLAARCVVLAAEPLEHEAALARW